MSEGYEFKIKDAADFQDQWKYIGKRPQSFLTWLQGPSDKEFYRLCKLLEIDMAAFEALNGDKRAIISEAIVHQMDKQDFDADTLIKWVITREKEQKPPKLEVVKATSEYKLIDIQRITTMRVLRDLFPIKDAVLDEITSRMQNPEIGYQKQYPVILGKGPWSDGKLVVVDGHTRLKAAQAAGMKQIPVIVVEFDSLQDAVDEATRAQGNRRNLDDWDIYHYVKTIDEEAKRKSERTEFSVLTSKTSRDVAKLLGIGKDKVEWTRHVQDHGDQDLKQKIKNGEVTIHSAWNQLKERHEEIKSKITKNMTTPDTPKPKQKEKKEGDPTTPETSTNEVEDRINSHLPSRIDHLWQKKEYVPGLEYALAWYRDTCPVRDMLPIFSKKQPVVDHEKTLCEWFARFKGVKIKQMKRKMATREGIMQEAYEMLSEFVDFPEHLEQGIEAAEGKK